ncbi:hypothetical protein [Celeribacter naphthalenivorans]|uniref:hypothetical protein n=1 Tax=Celeribacter naphthalenivorans TaxID=1614694 RepID=UPI001CFA69DD|nr:hypothetical protein [Celeribacter naphthalenivorans]
MLRAIGLAGMFSLAAISVQADDLSFLFCEYESLADDPISKSQSIPLYYEDGQLVAAGKRSHCVDEPQFYITDTHATWHCVTALNADKTPARSVYVEIHRFTGRYHRNDFDGVLDMGNVTESWHGVCTAHSEPQF